MKHFLLGSALVVTLMTTQFAHAQGNTVKDRQAYSGRVQSVFKASAPAMAQFGTLLKNEAVLQGQLQKHTITPQQYSARAPKPATWQAVIPKVRVAVRQLAMVKPVPSSMVQVNGGLVSFSSTMDKGLTKLDHWSRTQKKEDFKAALTDLGTAYMSLARTLRTAREKMGPTPR